MNYLLDRLKEPSTWSGLVLLATTFGLQVSPDQSEAVISVGLLCAGIIGVFTQDKGN
jgi:hypothetical protein